MPSKAAGAARREPSAAAPVARTRGADSIGLPQPLQRLRSGAGEEDGIGSLPLQLRGWIACMRDPWLGLALPGGEGGEDLLLRLDAGEEIEDVAVERRLLAPMERERPHHGETCFSANSAAISASAPAPAKNGALVGRPRGIEEARLDAPAIDPAVAVGGLETGREGGADRLAHAAQGAIRRL